MLVPGRTMMVNCTHSPCILMFLSCVLTNTGGIIQHHCDSSSIYVDHAVQIVGYDLTGIYTSSRCMACVSHAICVRGRPCSILDSEEHVGNRLGRRRICETQVWSEYVWWGMLCTHCVGGVISVGVVWHMFQVWEMKWCLLKMLLQ